MFYDARLWPKRIVVVERKMFQRIYYDRKHQPKEAIWSKRGRCHTACFHARHHRSERPHSARRCFSDHGPMRRSRFIEESDADKRTTRTNKSMRPRTNRQAQLIPRTTKVTRRRPSTFDFKDPRHPPLGFTVLFCGGQLWPEAIASGLGTNH